MNSRPFKVNALDKNHQLLKQAGAASLVHSVSIASRFAEDVSVSQVSVTDQENQIIFQLKTLPRTNKKPRLKPNPKTIAKAVFLFVFLVLLFDEFKERFVATTPTIATSCCSPIECGEAYLAVPAYASLPEVEVSLK